MESCKAGLENKINAKEAQETLKMPRKTCHDALELGNQARFSGLVGYKARLLSSKRSMLEMWLSSSGLANLLAQISVLYSRIVPASIYKIQLYVKR